MPCPQCGREGQPVNVSGTKFFCFNCDDDYFVDRGRQLNLQNVRVPETELGRTLKAILNHPAPAIDFSKAEQRVKNKAKFPPAPDVEHTIRGKIRKLKPADRVHVDLSSYPGKKGSRPDERPRLIITRNGQTETIQLHNRLAEELIALGLSYGT